MRWPTGDGDPAKRRPSAVLALSFSLLSQLSNPSHHTRHNSCAYGVAKLLSQLARATRPRARLERADARSPLLALRHIQHNYGFVRYYPGDDRQSFLWDETYNTFTIPMDPKGDDDRAQDLCMGTKRKYDWKLEEGMGVYGVNCDGDSEVEGDVFWTMPPKYELSY